jgi:hypothetical protein
MSDTLVEASGSLVEALAQEIREPQVVTVDDRQHLLIPEGWKREQLPQPLTFPPTVKVGTLLGLVGYLKENRDALALGGLVALVASPAHVDVFAPVQAPFGQRQWVACADLSLFGASGFPFGTWLDVEGFVIALQTHFVQTTPLADLLKIAGNVKDETVRQLDDDGMTQSVVARQGAALVDNVAIPNPITLAPYRTFREVEQPESRFLLRLRSGGPTWALFESDGGAWRLRAVELVRAWLAERLQSLGVAVIA